MFLGGFLNLYDGRYVGFYMWLLISKVVNILDYVCFFVKL